MDGLIASMSKEIILITGGARSGKSRYAEQRAVEMGGRSLYVATAEAKDEEMTQRIAEHRKRRGNQWRTIEEPLELTQALLAQRGKTDCALVDCLTLWISNLLIRHDDKYASEKVQELIEKLPQLDFHLLFVTNEVGWGIVPDNPLARKFRDLAGWTNQRIAQAANEVILMVGRNADDRKEGTRMLLEETLERIRPLIGPSRCEAQKRLDSLTKPQGSLGKLEELARRVAVIQRKSPAAARAKTVIRLRSGPRDYRGRRQRLPQRGHRANDLQLFCAAAPPSTF